MKNQVIETKKIQCPFSSDLTNNISLPAKDWQERQDKFLGCLLSLIPVSLLMVFESAAMAKKIIDEEPLQLKGLLNEIPFPLLYKLFENAPDEVKVFIAPVIFGTSAAVISGHIIGMGINKLRYVARNTQLNHELKDNKGIVTKTVNTKFKELSKFRTAKQAYVDTKEELLQNQL